MKPQVKGSYTTLPVGLHYQMQVVGSLAPIADVGSSLHSILTEGVQ